MHYFFDLDKTVAESRSKVTEEMKQALKRYKSVTIVSGAHEDQMRYQLDGLDVAIMSQNGNVNDLWQRYLTDEERQAIYRHIALYADKDIPDRTEDRGAQISYSFTGHHADFALKSAYDPKGEKRRALLDKYPAPEGIDIKIGGTTCLDYFPKGLHKGHNVFKYLTMKGWAIHSCVYVGDALFPGGNDESVIGVIPTYPVTGPKDTLRFLSI